MTGTFYEQLDDLRGTRAIHVRSSSGRTTARLCVDRRWYDQNNAIVPLDAHGPWTIVATHPDGM
ncbi:DNA methylase [Gordonia phage LonelyBoi]|nr:DNA methylase [Gordonia phage LonelyBoi]